MYSHHHSQSGFTLVETLVAVLIFSMSLAGLATIASRGVAGARSSANEIIAQYLAQEGVEMVRYLRDSNYMAARESGAATWDAGFSECVGDDIQCTIGFAEPGNGFVDLNVCPGSCPALQKTTDNEGGRYQYASGEETDFTRIIELRNVGDQQIEISSRVEWQQGSVPRSTEVAEIITHWQNI